MSTIKIPVELQIIPKKEMCSINEQDDDVFDHYFEKFTTMDKLQNTSDNYSNQKSPIAADNIALMLYATNTPWRRSLSCKYPSSKFSPKAKLRKSLDCYSGSNEKLVPSSCFSSEDVQFNVSLLSENLGSSKSAPNSRSNSVKRIHKYRKLKSSDTHDEIETPVTSNKRLDEIVSDELERVKNLQEDNCLPSRCFATSSKGLINRGDSFKRKHKSFQRPPIETQSLPNTPKLFTKQYEMKTKAKTHDILMIGDPGVGKTAMVQQFLTSQYMAAFTESDTEDFLDTDSGTSISVELDDMEMMLSFKTCLSEEVDVNHIRKINFDAYMVMYSVIDIASFKNAQIIIKKLKQKQKNRLVIIMVANKSDIVRARLITTEEGRYACALLDCKYIEISVALNHKVDELLVGLVRQVQLNDQQKCENEPDKAQNFAQTTLRFFEKLKKKKQSIGKNSIENFKVL